MFSFICVWINGLVNNREAGDLRRYRAHYDVTVMSLAWRVHNQPDQQTGATEWLSHGTERPKGRWLQPQDDDNDEATMNIGTLSAK